MTDALKENPNLSRRLKRALLITLLAVLVLATVAAAITAYLEASDIQDETLLSVAKLVETNQIGTNQTRNQRDTKFFDDDDVDDGAVRVWELGKKSRHGINIKKPLKQGFHTLREVDDFWRVYVTRNNRGGEQFIVAQKLGVSTEFALNSAKNTALPLLFLFLLVPLLVTLIVRHSFKPLNTLTKQLYRSDSLQLDIANREEIPVEVIPFVSAIDNLLEKNEAYNNRQRRFIADAAHELRTPITALSLDIENVRSASDPKLKSERQAALAKSISRLQRLVNQLLDLARAQSTWSGNEKVVSLNNIVKDQIGDLYPLLEEKSIELIVSRNDPVQLTDMNDQLQHLIRNALSNAIKFAPVFGNIDIEILVEADDAVFCVTDNGPGVAADQLEYLHQPFFRPEEQASGHGAGLGLAICHEIAAQMNGNITLENVSPAGFRFRYRQKVALL